MSVQRIKKSFIDKADRFVSMVFHDGELIGHAFYMRRNINKVGMITWILQLVVKKGYRGQQIGAKLMHSIWGLSDSFACVAFHFIPPIISLRYLFLISTGNVLFHTESLANRRLFRGIWNCPRTPILYQKTKFPTTTIFRIV